jgi:hypothetical protein
MSKKTPTVFFPQMTNLSFYTTKTHDVLVFLSTNTRLSLLFLSKKLLHLSFVCENSYFYEIFTKHSSTKYWKKWKYIGFNTRYSIDLDQILVKTLTLTINMVLKVNHVERIEEVNGLKGNKTILNRVNFVDNISRRQFL